MFIYLRNFGFILLSLSLFAGCSSNQTVKNAWKATRGTWYTYVNTPAAVDYEETGAIDSYEAALATRMIGIDTQWQGLERVMSNADKPPTGEWVKAFFEKFPWLTGFAGVNADGGIVGQAGPELNLDYAPLLEADKKQNVHALRGHVQQTSAGPEIMLGTPLYKDAEFLGVVVAYFNMRELMKFSTNPDELIVMAPDMVLWPGKFDVESTPLAKVKWNEVLAKNSSGKVSDGQGSFYWVNRYLGNQPIIFAVQATKDQPAKEERMAAVESSTLSQNVSAAISMPSLDVSPIAAAQAPAPGDQPQPAPAEQAAPAPTPAPPRRIAPPAESSPVRRSPAPMPSPIHPAPADSPERESASSPPMERLSPIHPAPAKKPAADGDARPSREIETVPKSDADIDVGSSRSVLRPPSPIHKAPEPYGKLPEVNLPE